MIRFSFAELFAELFAENKICKRNEQSQYDRMG